MARPTLVLLPGLLNTRQLFERQIADLSDLVDVVVPELYRYDSIGAMSPLEKPAEVSAALRRWLTQ